MTSITPDTDTLDSDTADVVLVEYWDDGNWYGLYQQGVLISYSEHGQDNESIVEALGQHTTALGQRCAETDMGVEALLIALNVAFTQYERSDQANYSDYDDMCYDSLEALLDAGGPSALAQVKSWPDG